jgi:hypothetical protein
MSASFDAANHFLDTRRASRNTQSNAHSRCNDFGALEDVTIAGLHRENDGVGDLFLLEDLQGVGSGSDKGREGGYEER